MLSEGDRAILGRHEAATPPTVLVTACVTSKLQD